MDFTNPDENIAHLKLASGARVAIFGSGAGGHSLAVCRAIENSGTIYAIDVRKEMLDRLKADASHGECSIIKAIHANIEEEGKTQIHDRSVDAVVIPNTLFSYEDHAGILKEAARIVVPQGKVLVIDWADSFGGMGPQPEDLISPQSVIEFATQANLSLVEQFSSGTQHYGLLFERKQ